MSHQRSLTPLNAISGILGFPDLSLCVDREADASSPPSTSSAPEESPSWGPATLARIRLDSNDQHFQSFSSSEGTDPSSSEGRRVLREGHGHSAERETRIPPPIRHAASYHVHPTTGESGSDLFAESSTVLPLRARFSLSGELLHCFVCYRVATEGMVLTLQGVVRVESGERERGKRERSLDPCPCRPPLPGGLWGGPQRSGDVSHSSGVPHLTPPLHIAHP